MEKFIRLLGFDGYDPQFVSSLLFFIGWILTAVLLAIYTLILPFVVYSYIYS